jgi:hypothetical protein
MMDDGAEDDEEKKSKVKFNDVADGCNMLLLF